MSRLIFLGLCLTLPAAAAAGDFADCPIAVLNVDRVLKASKPLEERLVPVKQKAAELDKTAQLKQVEIETTAGKLRSVQPGSKEFESLQVTLAKLQTELRIFIERERKNLRKSEADVFVTVYKEMEQAVADICREKKIKLVIRQNEGNEKDDNPDEVLKWLSRPVIFAENLDITEEVIAKMKERKKPE